jgi:outer membrane protein assembly factor BamB
VDRNTYEPYLTQATPGWDPATELELRRVENPLPNGTLGDIGLATEVVGPEEFPLTILTQPFDSHALVGIDVITVRVFRWDDESRTLYPVWNSGVNVNLGFIWTKIRRPGVYVPIGLPRDRLLQEALRSVARERHLADSDSPEEMRSLTETPMQLFSEAPAEAVEELRELVARVEVQTALPGAFPGDVNRRQGGHVASFPLPQDATLEEFGERISNLEIPPGGLPEEALFYSPDTLRNGEPPWPLSPEQQPWNGIDPRSLRSLGISQFIDPHILDILSRWLSSRNWSMYQHDVRHTGQASGWSDIRSTNVHTMVQQSRVSVDGPVISKPSIVDGKIYVGSGKIGGTGGGTLYKIDLATGNVEGTFATSGTAYYPVQGIGGSPAVVGGRVYFTGVHGKVYCIDAATMTLIWETDLRVPDAAHKQPVNQPNADCWSGPLVVNGMVYVGCGEGEEENTYGFIYCLDANTGKVVWLFCTSKFTNRFAPGSENQPNVIPGSVAVSDPLPAWATDAGFSIQPDAPPARETGSSVWSSCAYDRVLNRIYVGTGNSQYKGGEPGEGTDLPDEWYASGLISLDAGTGEFRGFFQPDPEDSYRPADADVDVPGAPTIFTRRGQRVVAFGSKNGSFFLLDPDTLAPLARRQLLPRAGGSGLPGDRGTAIPTVAPIEPPYFENQWGIYATPAVHPRLGRLYVGLGGREDITDQDKTPFIRALNWNTLEDAWPTAVGADTVSRYTTASPPLYTSFEVGLGSPAVVDDVVFMSTNKTALYALDAATGLCLWSAPDLPFSWPALGPAIYGNYVVMGAERNVYIYKLPSYGLAQAASTA